MAGGGMEVAFDGALPLDGPNRLDQLFAARLQAGGRGEVGQYLEGSPQPAVEIALAFVVTLPGERAAQQAKNIGRTAGRSFPQDLSGGRRARERSAGAPPPATPALAIQQGGKQTGQPVTAETHHPKTEGVGQPPALADPA